MKGCNKVSKEHVNLIRIYSVSIVNYIDFMLNMSFKFFFKLRELTLSSHYCRKVSARDIDLGIEDRMKVK